MYSGLYPCKQPVENKWLSTLTSNHLENRNADPNQQVLYHRLALLLTCGHHSVHRSDLVQAAVDAKGTSWDCNIQCDLNTSRCAVTEESEWTLGLVGQE
jgi:hypothetical protein